MRDKKCARCLCSVYLGESRIWLRNFWTSLGEGAKAVGRGRGLARKAREGGTRGEKGVKNWLTELELIEA